MPALAEAIKTTDKERERLEVKLAALDSPTNVFDARMEDEIRQRLEQWREVLGRNVAQARQIVTKLLTEKLSFTPEERDSQMGYRFEARGTVEKLLAGVVPGFSQGVVSLVVPSWNQITDSLSRLEQLGNFL